MNATVACFSTHRWVGATAFGGETGGADADVEAPGKGKEQIQRRVSESLIAKASND
jgi:hypothetical protein